MLDEMRKWIEELSQNVARGNRVTQTAYTVKTEASGFDLNEAPRGALGHWVSIQNRVISNYQLVVPSTWNFGPRDASNRRGPVEEALIGTPVIDPQRPVEVLRVVHSFDPCIACAVHIIHPETNKNYEIIIH